MVLPAGIVSRNPGSGEACGACRAAARWERRDRSSGPEAGQRRARAIRCPIPRASNVTFLVLHNFWQDFSCRLPRICYGIKPPPRNRGGRRSGV